MSGLILSNILAFMLCVAFITVLRRVSVTVALVDHPDARKRHDGHIPLCGGIAIFAAFAIVSSVSGQLLSLSVNYWLALAIILALGVADDRYQLSAFRRLLVQLLASLIMVAEFDTSSLSLNFFHTEIAALALVAFVISTCFITGLVNSWNMLDGVDGLAGGAAAVAIMWLLVISGFSGSSDVMPSLEILLVGICGFLIFNMRSPWRPRASIFLGDAGSTALGATLSYVILMLAAGDSAIPFAALLWVVIIPIIDTLSLMIRRVLDRRSPMSADRWHLHHLLLDSGLSPASATGVITALSAICGGIGYIGIVQGVSGFVMAAGLLVPAALHTGFVLMWRPRKPAFQRLLGSAASGSPEVISLAATKRDKSGVEI
ncbi:MULTISPECIES: MraY family glycosyltransferase [unclassified Sinorhizobium]|uniref:MraY family glycosyltransferase n=1 Tax=unclassified Sinorhizobium TaxID=2613772 RepID=UPI0035256F80